MNKNNYRYPVKIIQDALKKKRGKQKISDFACILNMQNVVYNNIENNEDCVLLSSMVLKFLNKFNIKCKILYEKDKDYKNNPILPDIVNYMEEYRYKLNLSSKKFSEYIGVMPCSYSGLKYGVTRPYHKRLYDVLNTLRMKLYFYE